MRYDAEHKARTRARVLQEAVGAIRSAGPEALGVADVMKRAGLTHGGFYAHFASREALLEAAVEAMFEAAGGLFEHAVEGLPPRDVLRAYVRSYVSRAHRDAQDALCCPLPILSGDLPRLNTPLRTRFARGVERLAARIARPLRELGWAEPEAVADSVLAEMVGAVALARAMGPTPRSDLLLANTRAALIGRLQLGDDA